ncbi:MAG: DNA-binding protein [Bradymonadaceae bacterium]|nr:DNA-binding protein [Lujinxingiaceae bacterium]
MIFEHSHTSHRLIGSLDAGEELVNALTSLCKSNNVRAGEIRAVGSFQNVELVRFDSRSKRYVEVLNGDGDFELVSLQGNISTMGSEIILRLDSLLSVAGPLGHQIVSGQLRAASVASCEFVIDVFADLRISRRLDPLRGLLVLDAIESIASSPSSAPPPAPRAPEAAPASRAAQPAPPPATTTAPAAPAAPPRPATGMSWSEAMAKSDEAKPASSRLAPRSGTRQNTAVDLGLDDDESTDPAMAPGDILDHPKLGRCRVMKIEDDDYAHIRLPRGKIRKLALAVCEIVFKGEEEGRKVFQVRVRK